MFKRFQLMLDPEKNKVIIDYLQAYNPVKIGIFGSYARNESRPDSDLDILINLNTAISLFQLVRIERELSELLGVKVDLVSDGSIKNKKLRNYIEADLKIIFQA
ncbi:MAG: nucleotidyltransferase family protein [Bacteroidetes bacterium]|nr:nucleotidyltransferase family protein [Bacteroidota bacterium]